MNARESGGRIQAGGVDPVLWAEIHESMEGRREGDVYAVNAGWVTTHLTSEHQMRKAPSTPRSALCGKSMPDAGEPWGQPMPHPSLERPEKLCPKRQDHDRRSKPGAPEKGRLTGSPSRCLASTGSPGEPDRR